MKLVRACPEYRSAFLDVAREWRETGDDRYGGALEDFDAWLEDVEAHARDATCPPHLVPWDHLWLVDEQGRILGRCNLRHRLSRRLETEGGHIGYDVRPSERRKGIGTRLLALALEKASDRGIRRVLLTCDHDNVASARIIEKNGGEEFESSVSPRSGKRVRRFWIDVARG